MNIPVLIPAYQPDKTLSEVVSKLLETGFQNIIVVNDGSDEGSNAILESLRTTKGCVVLDHAVNMGKGRALKTGLNYFYLNFPEAEGVITADADGQHLPEDIMNVAREMKKNPDKLIMGARSFEKDIPFKSLIGNVLTRYVFYFLVGKKLADTQSGLRGISRRLVPALLNLEGERYEYEMNMLISTKVFNTEIEEVPIQTVYIEQNRASHFNPLTDSMKIYFLLLRFAFSSIFTSLVDFIVFTFTYAFNPNIGISIIIARLVASVINFTINKKFVFHSQTKNFDPIIKYYTLLVAMGTVAYISIETLTTRFFMNVILAKILTEGLLFLASFTIQRDLIFTSKPKNQ